MKFKLLALAALVVVTALPAAAEVSLDDILVKHVESKGGMDALNAIETMRIEGHIGLGPGMEPAPLTMEIKRPDSMRMEFVFQGVAGIQAYDGETGWQVMPFNGSTEPQKVTGPDLDEFVERSDLDGPLINYEKRGDTVEFLGTEDVEGTPAHKVKVTKKSGTETVYYLDVERCLEIRAESTANMQGMEIDIEVTFGDYKEVAGVMMAHSISQTAKGSPMAQSITFDKISANIDIPAERFAMPAVEAQEPEVPAAPSGLKVD